MGDINADQGLVFQKKISIAWTNNHIPPITVLTLEILVASDFDQIAGTAIYYIQYYYM